MDLVCGTFTHDGGSILTKITGCKLGVRCVTFVSKNHLDIRRPISRRDRKMVAPFSPDLVMEPGTWLMETSSTSSWDERSFPSPLVGCVVQGGVRFFFGGELFVENKVVCCFQSFWSLAPMAAISGNTVSVAITTRL